MTGFSRGPRRHWGVLPYRPTDGFEDICALHRVGFWTVNINTRHGINLDATEECGEEKLISVGVVERQSSEAFLEAVELGGIGGQRQPSITVAISIGRTSHGPANEDKLGVFGRKGKFELFVEDWVEAIGWNDLGSSPVRCA